MMTFPNIDPVAISLGPIKVHWYGLMYLIGFAAVWLLGKKRSKKSYSPVKPEEIDDWVFYGAMGVILGGRMGYILFYNFSQFLNDPLLIFKVWEGGMSFHGGLLGVFFAMWLFARKNQCKMLELTDFVGPMIPIGLFCGRIANFINAELWGRTTDVPWGVVFPGAGPLPRHPSQLYEAFLEGFLLFLILWIYSSRQRPYMAVTGMSLLFYGLFRFTVEFFRMPDAHLGFVALDWMSMGQILSLPMIIIGAALIFFGYRKSVCNSI